MGHTAKDRNMDQYHPSSSSLKQGYLHIKRERTTSMFAKLWQQAYFILRREPFIMEEYKDASLKTQKQLHFIGTIRHVGRIRTSKSQQFAFEVVMKEKTPLLLACDNQILMNEWIDAFYKVMNTVGDCVDSKQSTANNPPVITFHSSLERKGSQYDAHNVTIVETTLSKSNELVGDYYLMMTSARMQLLTVGGLTEILSWPIGNVTYYTSQPHLNQVILVMGKTCHFGNGKLIFETTQHDQIFKSIEMYQLKSPKNRNSAGKSTNSSSSISNGSNSLSDKSVLSVSYDDEQPVFDPLSDQKVSKASKLSQDRKPRSFSFPDVPDCESPFNTHKKLQHADPFQNNNNKPQSNSSPALPIKLFKLDTAKSESDILLAFPEITSEEGYILPNEQDVNAARTQTLLCKVNGQSQQQQEQQPIEFSSQSPNGSDNENEFSTSYLQIIDSDENADDPVAKRLLNDITSQLENPVANPSSYLMSLNARKKNNKNVGSEQSPRQSPKQSPKYNIDYRRSSEPAKNVLRSFDKEQGKFQNSKKTHSVDYADPPPDPLSRSHNSPQMHSKLQHHPQLASIAYNSKNAFPKQHSISQGNHSSLAKSDQHSSNPFGKLESYFLKHSNRSISQSFSFSQQPNKAQHGMTRKNNSEPMNFKSPELDRNMKPKPNGRHNPNRNSQPLEEDEPPPVPERQSPKQLQSHAQHNLRREPALNEEDEDDIDIDCISDTTEESNSRNRRDSSSIESVHNSGVCSIEKINNNYNNNNNHSFLHPPPLPPKSKPLSCTKSAPMPARENQQYEKKKVLTRCSSLNSDSFSGIDKLSDISFNGPILVKSERSSSDVTRGSISDDYNEVPPAVPCRLPVDSLKKKKHLSTSEGNLLKPYLLTLR